MQRRSAQKKIGPLQWDLSVAEHLGLGESYKDAAERGLRYDVFYDGLQSFSALS